jgi:hypothetical protein
MIWWAQTWTGIAWLGGSAFVVGFCLDSGRRIANRIWH